MITNFKLCASSLFVCKLFSKTWTKESKEQYAGTNIGKDNNLYYLIDPAVGILIDCFFNPSKPVKMILQEILLISITCH